LFVYEKQIFTANGVNECKKFGLNFALWQKP